MKWKNFPRYSPKDDKNYLVVWQKANGKHSSFHRAYFDREEGKFFSLENNNGHPIHVDAYLEIPNVN